MTRLDPMPDGFEGKTARECSPSELRSLLAWSKAAYDSEIGFVDSRIREIFEMLDLEDAIVVFLSDHGEEFYEHSNLTHGQNLYGETMRVPLFLYVPHADAPRGRVESHVSTLDIVPTLRRLLQVAASPQDQGQDLLADVTRQPVYGILEGKSGQHDLDSDLRSIVVGDHRLIALEGGRVELYDLATDPLERTDLAEELPEVVAELLGELDRIERSAPEYPRTTRLPSILSEAMLEHLRGIGYLGEE
jgi:arylsulfatase A-like enzyme